ncbi:MAG TPA: hypothetical protein VHT71_08085 [Methylomirabilota bacterium]|jgi:hypothetical protein|nr:hypothetical protein [Methylomirabilota bacterium]
MALRVLRSSATEPNPEVVPLDRASPRESNTSWLRRALADPHVATGPEWSLLLLMGGADPLSFRLRVAQSHVRHDLSPSAWSHVAFLPEIYDSLAKTPAIEVSLAPAASFGECGFPSPFNGLQESTLERYLDGALVPNLALLSVPVPSTEIVESLNVLRWQRSTFDVPQMILRWLAYCWGVGVPASPLAEGLGVPSAAVLEAAFAMRHFDLTPGLESRSSCPEAIWQAASWWHGFYKQRIEGGRAIRGVFCARHELVPDGFFGGSPAGRTAEEKPS